MYSNVNLNKRKTFLTAANMKHLFSTDKDEDENTFDSTKMFQIKEDNDYNDDGKEFTNNESKLNRVGSKRRCKNSERRRSSFMNTFYLSKTRLSIDSYLKQSKYQETIASLTQILNDYFKIDYEAIDFNFMCELFNFVDALNKTWDRIGFTKKTKINRLNKHYEKLNVLLDEIIEDEKDLEQKIIHNNENSRINIQQLKVILNLNEDESSNLKEVKPKTILEEHEMLKAELNRLEREKMCRLEEYKHLAIREEELCNRLNIEKTDLSLLVPTEQELNDLAERIEDLKNLFDQREKEMCELKEELKILKNDLSESSLNSDSFIELLINEPIEKIPLTEYEIRRARSIRDELKQQVNQTSIEIKSLRLKIRDLWSKLGISNPFLVKFINESGSSESFCLENSNDLSRMPKIMIVKELQDEYERCLQIKKENIDKFIQLARDKINVYCRKMFIGQNEMSQINENLLKQTELDEDLFEKHQEKLEDLEFRYVESESIYELASKWIQLWSDFLKFSEISKDPNRFKIKGYKMYEEEKQRKHFQTQFPKLEEELEDLCAQYRKMNGGDEFKMYGVNYKDYIQLQKKTTNQIASNPNEKRENKHLLVDSTNKMKHSANFNKVKAAAAAIKPDNEILKSPRFWAPPTFQRDPSKKLTSTLIDE